MSAPLLLGIAVGLLLLGLAVWILLGQFNKYNELRELVNKLNNDVGVLRDSQQGLGAHVLELEREQHGLLRLQSSLDQPVVDGALNQIAGRLRAGASSAEIVAALGVSEAEVKLVQVIVQNIDAQQGDVRRDTEQPAVQSGNLDSGEPIV